MFKPTGRRSRRAGVVLAVVLVAAGAAWAGSSHAALGAETDGTTSRVSVSSSGAQSNDQSWAEPAISPDGRFVVFTNSASNLSPYEDTNDANDVFVRDRTLGSTEQVSVSSNEAPGNDGSSFGALSADGRYVAFWSNASNLVPADTNGSYDLFVRDRTLETTRRISVSSSERQSNDGGGSVSISADGRYVAYVSRASNLVRGDTNGRADVFVRDRALATTRRVSVSSNQTQGNRDSLQPVLSADGKRVVFLTDASNLVSGDTNDAGDVFLRYRPTGTTSRVSVSNTERQGNASTYHSASVSANGRYVAFASGAWNLVSGDEFGWGDVFVRDRIAGTTQRVSMNSNEAPADRSSGWPSISADGQRVAFLSDATNLVDGDIGFPADVFLRDRVSGTTSLVSVSSDVLHLDGDSGYPAISGDGRHVVFESLATNLVPGDTNQRQDTFVRDLAP